MMPDDDRERFDLKRPLVEGDDYTIENGLLVFTAAYHLRRGWCCGSGCRNCPFGFAKPGQRRDPDERQTDSPSPD
jgi:hypothetical protein